MQLIKRVFVGIIIVAACLASGVPVVSARDFVVVIDAGHGGKDPGAKGKNSREKDINLSVALKLGKLIEKNMKDVKVVYTRKNDSFISLQGRADIANEAGGDLFISIHTNSAPEKSKNRAYVNGTSVYVLGRKSEENLAVAQRENAVIMLEDDYKTAYAGFDPNSPESYIAFELIQNQHMEHSLQAARSIQNELVATAGRKDNGVRQAMFWVLVKTGMPAVLVELDYICNPRVERYISSDAGQTQLAESIFNGFKVYKSTFDKEVARLGRGADSAAVVGERFPTPGKTSDKSSDKKQKKEKKEKEKKDKKDKKDKKEKAATPADAIVYKVQFLTSSRPLGSNSPQFKGLADVDSYREGGIVKYTVGATTDQAEAAELLKEVKKKFGDAFIIATRNGERIR